MDPRYAPATLQQFKHVAIGRGHGGPLNYPKEATLKIVMID